jgi:hypothetical protein
MMDAAAKIWKGEGMDLHCIFFLTHPLISTFSLSTLYLTKLGFWGFYRGSAANYLKVIPMQATSFLIYDTLKKRFNF